MLTCKPEQGEMTMTQIAIKVATDCRPLDWFKPDADQLGRHSDPEKVRLRGLNMQAHGQLQPVGATEDGRLIFGHGRWLAAKAVGIKTLEVKLFPASLSDTQFSLIRAAENLQRNELNGHEKWRLCADLMSDNASWQLKDLAEHLHLDPSMVTRLLSPSKCITAWQEALSAGKVGISDCYAASKLNESEQSELLRLKLSGASRDAIEQAGRRKRTPAAATVRLSRIKAMLPSGVVIVASGEGLTLDDLIQSFGDALREAKKAREQGLDARTFQAVLRDKAKKG
jgi:ParB/RepB/Spo0J family partition protein